MAARLSRRKIATYYAGALAAGTKPDTLAQELAAFLIDTRRTKEIDLIIRDVEYALVDYGIVVADVVSAHELSLSTRQAIIVLAQKRSSASHVELRTTIDQSVLGGIKVDFAGLRIDDTIQQRLTKLRANHKI